MVCAQWAMETPQSCWRWGEMMGQSNTCCCSPHLYPPGHPPLRDPKGHQQPQKLRYKVPPHPPQLVTSCDLLVFFTNSRDNPKIHQKGEALPRLRPSENTVVELHQIRTNNVEATAPKDLQQISTYSDTQSVRTLVLPSLSGYILWSPGFLC